MKRAGKGALYKTPIMLDPMAENVEIEPQRKREILELDAKVGSTDHFAILGVPPGSPADVVKKAYYEATKRLHPDRFFGKNTGSFKPRIERIFKRLTEANAVLTDPAKRAAYLSAHPELAVGGEDRPSAPEQSRLAERRSRLAHHPYLARNAKVAELVTRAKALIAQRDYGKAYTELSLALQIDPKHVEVQQLLLTLRQEHEASRTDRELSLAREAEAMGELEKALTHYRMASTLDPRSAPAAFKTALLGHRQGLELKETKPLAQRAVELEPRNAEYRCLLGLLLLSADMKKLARAQFEEALKLNPEHAESKKQLRKLRWTL